MKKVKYFLSFFFCFFLWYFSFSQQPQLTQTLNDSKYIKEAFVKSQCIYSFLTPTDSVIYCENLFDTLGRLVLAKSFSINGKQVDADTLLYNEKNDLYKEIQVDSTSIVNHIILYLYDADNKLQQINKYNGSQKLVYSENRKYDVKDNLIEIDERTDSVYKPQAIFVFDKNGLNVISNYYKGDHNLNIFENKYSKSRNLLLSRSENPKAKIIVKYSYDEMNKCLTRKYKVKAKSPGMIPFSTLETFSYYPNNLLFEKMYYENADPRGRLKSYYRFYK